MRQLVIKDIKLKYRRSFLGYIWSILNPLMIMIIMVIVFRQMFRFNIENYPVYLIIGSTLFSFMSDATTQAMWSIMGNSALLKKTYVPKYIFTLSKITSSFVNTLFSLGAMLIVFIVCGVHFNFYMNLSCVFEKTTLPINKETIATLKPYIIHFASGNTPCKTIIRNCVT